jgi:hypothetical protein
MDRELKSPNGERSLPPPSLFTENPACWLETGKRRAPVPVLPFSSTIITGSTNCSSGLSALVKKVYLPESVRLGISADCVDFKRKS